MKEFRIFSVLANLGASFAAAGLVVVGLGLYISHLSDEPILLLVPPEKRGFWVPALVLFGAILRILFLVAASLLISLSWGAGLVLPRRVGQVLPIATIAIMMPILTSLIWCGPKAETVTQAIVGCFPATASVFLLPYLLLVGGIVVVLLPFRDNLSLRPPLALLSMASLLGAVIFLRLWQITREQWACFVGDSLLVWGAHFGAAWVFLQAFRFQANRRQRPDGTC